MEALIIADEIIGMTRFMLAGIDITETTLALDVISRARPGGGFLADDHTLDNWKWAQWKPDIMDRNRYQSWERLGGRDMFARANEQARKIMTEHELSPLPVDAEAVIEDVLARRAAAARN